MPHPKRLDILFALLGTGAEDRIDGTTLIKRLTRGGFTARPASVLSKVLELEESGHVAVQRAPDYAFGLTPLGQGAAHDLGPGVRIDAVVLMIDLVGFVAFTEEHGDDAAHRAASSLHDAAEIELNSRAGRVVKLLGDGVLGTLPPGSDPSNAVTSIARRCQRPDGSRWALRAAAREGRPISHGGDLFGADVNLVSRLCETALPNELVVAVGPAVSATERVDVRGLTEAVPIVRVPVP